MTLRFQRLLFILLSFIMVLTAVLLILFNSKNNIIFFYTPSELLDENPALRTTVRIGAYVENDSLKKISSDTFEFRITDNKSSIKITYQGILPDLFREGQGAVVEGLLIEKKHIIAEIVYAKHDENYMPATLQKDLENKKYWQKNYK